MDDGRCAGIVYRLLPIVSAFTPDRGSLYKEFSFAAAIVAHPIANRQATGVICIFGALLFVCYLTVQGLERRSSTVNV